MPTLLVIDDQQLVRDTLFHILTAQGFTVLPAESGAAGIALFESRSIDGALVDIHMPGRNGVDVCRELRAKAQLAGRDLPVWLMTGACTTDLRRLAAAAGALTIFEKPFNVVELGQTLKKRLSEAPVLTATTLPGT